MGDLCDYCVYLADLKAVLSEFVMVLFKDVSEVHIVRVLRHPGFLHMHQSSIQSRCTSPFLQVEYAATTETF